MFETAADTLKFIGGGNATLTVKSIRTGDHFTFKIQKPTVQGSTKRDFGSQMNFVKVLTGSPDDWNSWHFIGFFRDGGPLAQTRKDLGAGRPKSPSFQAFEWLLNQLRAGKLPSDQAEVQHAGKCCRCGRTLTHPESLASGIGPECAKHFGGF
jgi:hypothetical protein